MRYGLRLVVPLAGTVLLLSSCGGVNRQTGSYDAGEAAPVPAAAPERNASLSGGGADTRETGSGLTADGPVVQEKAGQTQSVQVKPAPQDRAIIYTAEMTVRAKEVTAAADRARQIVTAAGGHLASERSEANPGGKGSALLIFKIPPAAYPGMLDRLGRELGTRESLQQNTEDVTEQVADVESRLKSSKAALDSLRTLLGKAKTIGEVLKVEREVSDREAELEALQARQRTLASQTSTATLTLRLIGPTVKVRKIEKEPAGFLGGLRTGWKALVTAVKVGLTVLGVLLPWLIAAVPLWLLTVFVLRRRRGGASPAPSPGGGRGGSGDTRGANDRAGVSGAEATGGTDDTDGAGRADDTPGAGRG
ncbi:hypothetical protein GCM10017673_07570 [Streptosporangium violaceochromogenes]|nr:hypothetical protein GCM10017673_07570 [Streptosporangium violaceochromogenes]